MKDETIQIEIRGLEMAYGSFVVMRDINTRIRRGEVFVIIGGSGCGKSTLLRHLIGLKPTPKGEILYEGRSFTRADPAELASLRRKFGVLFQGSALWSSMTLAENVSLPLERYTRLSPSEIRELVRLKLAWVGLGGFEDYYPSEISGGMAKRAGLARALALDPPMLFCDEPSAGLDPLNSRRLDDLLLSLRDNLGTTIVVVTHELQSIFAIADTSLFLNVETRTVTAQGPPRELLEHSDDPAVREFLGGGRRQQSPASSPSPGSPHPSSS